MKKSMLDIYYVWMNELKIVLKDPAILIIFFLVSFGYPVLYTYIYNNEVVRDVKVVVVDDSHSSLGREFVRKMDASPDVRIVGRAADMAEAKELMYSKEAYGILYIPSDFSRNLHSNKQTQVNVYADMSSLLFYKAILLSATEVSLDMGADIRVSDMGFKSQEEDRVTMQAVSNEWVTLYNVPNGFASFLIPAVLILIIQQTLVLGVSTLVGTHNDKKAYTIASHTSRTRKNINAFKLTLGKAFCYATVYMFLSVWIIRIVPYLFSLPQIGSPLTIAIFLVPFILAATFFAMTISYMCSQREFAMPLFVFTSVLFVFLSGISWPWTNMPEPLKAVAMLIPSTPGIHGFVKINTMGAGLSDVMPEYIALWIHVGVYWLTATLMYFWWIKNYDPRFKGQFHSAQD